MSSGADGTPQYIRGVPHALPEGEHILWQGAPEAGAVATHVFHWRLFMAYFAAMIAIWVASTELPFASSAFQAGLGIRVGLSALVVAIVMTSSYITGVVAPLEAAITDALFTRALRAAIHGFVLLELADGFGLASDVDASFEVAVRAVIAAAS